MCRLKEQRMYII